MTMTERTGVRDLSYSAWHRSKSIGRFLSDFDKNKHRIRLMDGSWCEYSDPWKQSTADKLGLIDIDHIVYDGKHWTDRKPVALIESARTDGEYTYDKAATMMAMIGEAANIPVFVVLYQLSRLPNPFQPECNDIDWFFVRRYWPAKERGYRQMTPKQYAEFLVMLRQEKGKHYQPPLHPTWPLVSETDIKKLTFYEQETT